MFQFNQRLMQVFNGGKVLAYFREKTNDWNTLFSVLHHDEYGFADFEFKNGDVVIDIGAHIGGELLYFCTLGKKIKYYAYEPLPENCDLMKKNAESNTLLMDYEIFQMAVGKENKMSKAWYGAMDNELAKHHHFIGNLKNLPRGKSIPVQEITLEKIFKDNKIKRCKLMKIDAEGVEKEIFETTPKYVLEKIDWIVGEHHNILKEDLFKLTKGVFIDVPCKYPAEKDGPHLGNFKWKNIII